MNQSPVRTAAITGASGYLGGVLSNHLRANGWNTIALVRSPRGEGSRQYIIDSEPNHDLLDGVDTLVHCAYDMKVRDASAIWKTNVEGTQRLIAFANQVGIPRIIVLSSMSAYSGTSQLYGQSKLAIEDLTQQAGAISVRPGLVYGPNAGGMAGALTALTRLPLVPVVAARSHQFTVHEDDFASAVRAIMETKSIATGPIGIANPIAVPFRKIVEGLGRMNGRRCRTVSVSWSAVHAALRLCERIGVNTPFRADSLLGLAHPAPYVPNLDILDGLGIALRRFNQPISAL